MNISVGSHLMRKTSLVILGFLLLAILLALIELLRSMLPDFNTFIMFLAPQFFGLGIMLYVVVSSRESVASMQARERALLASQERFEYLYKSSPVPYINIDAKGSIFLLNLAAIRLLGSTEQKIIGQSLLKMFNHESETKLSIIINQLESQTPISDVEVILNAFDGKRKWVLLSAFTYGDKKEQLVSMVDITRQKEIDMAKTEFVTLASHQLRTPIAATRWNFELLESLHTTRTPEQEKYYGKMKSNIERLASLVNDFLQVSKLELGTFATDPHRINVSEFIKGCAEEFDSGVKEKDINLETSFDPEDLESDFDPRLLRIVVTNLLSNAIKYTPKKGTVKVSYELRDNRIYLQVSDTGIGVPLDEIDKLFSRFYRASNAQTQHVEGTGLGLYIAKQAVAKMGGTIKVESELGKGTAFHISLPV